MSNAKITVRATHETDGQSGYPCSFGFELVIQWIGERFTLAGLVGDQPYDEKKKRVESLSAGVRRATEIARKLEDYGITVEVVVEDVEKLQKQRAELEKQLDDLHDELASIPKV